MATCNVNTLLETGKDFQRCSDRDLSVCECQLLCDISAGGGGGGGSGQQTGTGTPVGVKTPDYVGQIYTDTGPPPLPPSLWYATGATSADWIEVIGNL